MTTLLKLYPAAFRREFGEEMAHAYHEATAGAGRTERLREAADVIGHALRMRLGLGSTGRAGRLVAAVAPFAAVALGGYASWWSGLALRPLSVVAFEDLGVTFPLLALHQLVTLLGVVMALTGRWTAGTWTALAGIVAGLGVDAARGNPGGFGFTALFIAPALLLAVVALLCPPDLRPVGRVRTVTGVAATTVWAAAMVIALVVPSPAYNPLDALQTLVPVAGGLLLAGRQAFARLRTAPAVFLAGLPFVVLGTMTGALNVLAAGPALGLLLGAAVVVGVRGRRGGRDPLAGA
ncbi:hypothetical protein [Streptomyces sp. NPDC048606]|uniref:hypothetical protein n=1 Tax=Streptomyces sp. NPDC048606 TaxID=3154726 RepID=UPI0034190528